MHGIEVPLVVQKCDEMPLAMRAYLSNGASKVSTKSARTQMITRVIAQTFFSMTLSFFLSTR